jgi:HSP20 family molecular chaperone IbpA
VNSRKRIDKDEEIRRLKEKLKEPEGEKSEGIASGILHEAGKLLGIEGLLKKAANTHHIKERLEMIDEEIKQRLSEISINIPEKGRPAVRRGVVRKRPVTEIETDVFDEAEYLLAVASMPGVDEESIGVILDGHTLTISYERNGRSRKKELTLPFAPKGRVERTFRNGVLKVKINKEADT